MKKQSFLTKRFDTEDKFYDAELSKNITTGIINIHSHFLIFLFKRNQGTQHLNNTECKFEPGYAIISSPFDFNFNETFENESFDAYSVKFTHKVFNENLYKICSLDQFPIIAKLNKKDYQTAETLCNFLISEKTNRASLTQEILIRNAIEQLFIIIMRNSVKKLPSSSSSLPIVNALNFIHDNFKNKITVKDVADVCNYTPNYFSYCFKKEMGISFQKYLYNLRLDYAYNLIKYENKSCSEACFKSGFNSVEYFSASFKNKFGYSPKKTI